MEVVERGSKELRPVGLWVLGGLSAALWASCLGRGGVEGRMLEGSGL